MTCTESNKKKKRQLNTVGGGWHSEAHTPAGAAAAHDADAEPVPTAEAVRTAPVALAHSGAQAARLLARKTS